VLRICPLPNAPEDPRPARKHRPGQWASPPADALEQLGPFLQRLTENAIRQVAAALARRGQSVRRSR